MKLARAVAWVLLAAFALWLEGLAALARSAGLGAWAPALGLVLALALAARAEPADLWKIALVSALARAALSGERLLPLALGIAGALALVLAVRAWLEPRRPLVRAGLAACAACALELWLAAAQRASLPASAGLGAGAFVRVDLLVPLALGSALAALLVAPLLERLPGLAPLRTRPW